MTSPNDAAHRQRSTRTDGKAGLDIEAGKPIRAAPDWLPTLRRYMAWMAIASLIWEFAHMPLYTIWETGTASEIVFAAVHCTGGDILIALSALVAALFLFGTGRWPEYGYWRVALSAIALGLGYTVFSEWLNVGVRGAWAYRSSMPIIPLIDVGVSPLAQWIVVPSLAFWRAICGKEHR